MLILEDHGDRLKLESDPRRAPHLRSWSGADGVKERLGEPCLRSESCLELIPIEVERWLAPGDMASSTLMALPSLD